MMKYQINQFKYFAWFKKQRRYTKQYLLLTITTLLMVTNVSAKDINQSTTGSQEVQEWVVVLKDPRPARLQGWQSSKYRTSANYKSGLELKRIGSRFAKKNGLKLKQEWFIDSLSVYCLIVEFTEDTNTTLSKLENNKMVEWVQKSNDFELLGTTKEQKKIETASFLKEKKSNALPFNYDGSGTVIAIIDSRTDMQHQDLMHAVKSVTDFVTTKPENTNIAQAEIHGTAIAGVLIAQPNDQYGITGIAPAAELFAFRGCWEESATVTNCNTLSLARALDAVIKLNPDILNLSLSGPNDPLLNKLISRIVKKKTVVVAAFDPKRTNAERFPVPQKGVLIVRAQSIDTQYESAFTAPGAQIVTTPNNNYTYLTGHSIASAHTSGLLALLTQATSQKLTAQMAIDKAMSGKLKSSEFLFEQLVN